MNKRLFILAGLVLLIWLGVYLVPEDKPVHKTDAGWPAFSMNSTSRIDQEGAEKNFSLRKIKGEWFASASGVAEPGLRLDITKVDALLQYVGSHQPKRRLGALGVEESKKFGLDKPVAGITFYGDSQWKIQLGAKNATARGVYAESSKESGELLLLDAQYAEQFRRDASHYYDLRLLTLQPDAVVRAALETEDGSGWDIEVTNNKPAFIAPAAMTQKKVSRTAFDDYLRDVASLKGKSFVLDKAAAQGEQLAALRIWKNGVPNPVLIRILKPASGEGKAPALLAVSSWQNAPQELSADVLARIVKPAFSLRDRSVLQLSPGQVERQVLRRVAVDGEAAEELAAHKEKSGWKVDGKERQGLDLLLWRLSDLKYETEPVGEFPAGAQKDLEWELFGADNVLLHTLAFYRAATGAVSSKNISWVAVDDKTPYYPVSSKLAGDLVALLPAAGHMDSNTAADDGQALENEE